MLSLHRCACAEVERRIFLFMPFSFEREDLCNAILNGGKDEQCYGCRELKEQINDPEEQIKNVEEEQQTREVVVDVEKLLLRIMRL